MLCSQLFEWCEQGISAQINNQDMQNVDWHQAGVGEWYETLAGDRVLMRRQSEYNSVEHALLDEQNILSILGVPLFINNKIWGFIGFDDCESERSWSDMEIASLESAVGIIGGAIERRAIQTSTERKRATFSWLGRIDQ